MENPTEKKLRRVLKVLADIEDMLDAESRALTDTEMEIQELVLITRRANKA